MRKHRFTSGIRPSCLDARRDYGMLGGLNSHLQRPRLCILLQIASDALGLKDTSGDPLAPMHDDRQIHARSAALDLEPTLRTYLGCT